MEQTGPLENPGHVIGASPLGEKVEQFSSDSYVESQGPLSGEKRDWGGESPPIRPF